MYMYIVYTYLCLHCLICSCYCFEYCSLGVSVHICITLLMCYNRITCLYVHVNDTFIQFRLSYSFSSVNHLGNCFCISLGWKQCCTCICTFTFCVHVHFVTLLGNLYSIITIIIKCFFIAHIT